MTDWTEEPSHAAMIKSTLLAMSPHMQRRNLQVAIDYQRSEIRARNPHNGLTQRLKADVENGAVVIFWRFDDEGPDIPMGDVTPAEAARRVGNVVRAPDADAEQPAQ